MSGGASSSTSVSLPRCRWTASRSIRRIRADPIRSCSRTRRALMRATRCPSEPKTPCSRSPVSSSASVRSGAVGRMRGGRVGSAESSAIATPVGGSQRPSTIRPATSRSLTRLSGFRLGLDTDPLLLFADRLELDRDAGSRMALDAIVEPIPEQAPAGALDTPEILQRRREAAFDLHLEPVTVEAGAEDLRLTLVLAGALRSDASGRPTLEAQETESAALREERLEQGEDLAWRDEARQAGARLLLDPCDLEAQPARLFCGSPRLLGGGRAQLGRRRLTKGLDPLLGPLDAEGDLLARLADAPEHQGVHGEEREAPGVRADQHALAQRMTAKGIVVEREAARDRLEKGLHRSEPPEDASDSWVARRKARPGPPSSGRSISRVRKRRSAKPGSLPSPRRNRGTSSARSVRPWRVRVFPPSLSSIRSSQTSSMSCLASPSSRTS